MVITKMILIAVHSVKEKLYLLTPFNLSMALVTTNNNAFEIKRIMILISPLFWIISTTVSFNIHPNDFNVIKLISKAHISKLNGTNIFSKSEPLSKKSAIKKLIIILNPPNIPS